jgi:hypothetical protein
LARPSPDPSPDRSDDPDTSAQAFRFTAAVLFAAIAVTTFAQLPQRLTGGWLHAQRSSYAVLWPQRWGFFGDTADTDVVVAYLVDATGAATVEPTQRHMSPENLWGLGRVSDTEQNEIVYVTSQLPREEWRLCAAASLAGCRSLTGRPYRLANGFPAARLCGRVAFAILRPGAGPPGPTPSRRRVGAVALTQLSCVGRA